MSVSTNNIVSGVNSSAYPSGHLGKLVNSLGYSYANETFTLVGDSTGNETTEWFYLMLQQLIADLPPTSYVAYRIYNDAQGRYDAPTVLQTGAGEPFVTVGVLS